MTEQAAIALDTIEERPIRRFMSQEARGKQCQAVLDLIEHEGISEYEACKRVGIHQNTFRQLALKHISSVDYARAISVIAHQQVSKLEEVITDMRSGVLDAAEARVEIDTRKWIAARLLPKQYGDKLIQEVTGADGGALKIEAVSPLDIIEAKLARLRDTSKAKD